MRLAGPTLLLKGYNSKEVNIFTFKRKITIVHNRWKIRVKLLRTMHILPLVKVPSVRFIISSSCCYTGLGLVWHSRLLDLDDAARWRGDHPRAVRVVEVRVRVQRRAEKIHYCRKCLEIYKNSVIQNIFFWGCSQNSQRWQGLVSVALDFFFCCT